MQKATNASFFTPPLSNHIQCDTGADSNRWLLWKIGGVLASFLIVLALCAGPALAQHEVTGEVSDAEDGSTLPGVNIAVQGTTIGTATRSDGSYTLEAPSPSDTLVFSFVGYQEQLVPIDGRSEVNVQMELAVTALEEVVVEVGYGQQTIETTTGSVSQVSGEELDAVPTTNLSQTLQGAVPGLIGVTTSGRPGMDNSNLLIRGASTMNNNSPLVVIDGVPGRQGGLARLNPSDIQSISVLKDASAAIYGSRAANGVILIKTKQGRVGETQVNVNLERNWSQPTVVPEMADAVTFMTMLNEVSEYNENPPIYSQEAIEQHRNCPAGSYSCFNTDWYDAALKDYSREITANASVTGGSESFQYRISAEGVTEEGILVNSGTGYNQLGFRSNLNGDVTDNFNVGLNVHGRLENRDLPAWTRGLNSAWELLQRGKPNEPAFWPNGQPGPAQENGVNPVVANETGYQDEKIYYFQSDLTLGLDVPGVEGWSVEGTVAYDQMFLNRKRWQEPWTLYSCSSGCSGGDDGDPVLIGTQVGVPEPRLEQWDGSKRDILLRATTNYERSIGNSHNGSLLLGTEYQSADSSGTWAFRRFFPTNQIQELFAGGQSQQDLFGTSLQRARLNFFGRFNYNYQQKYLFEFVARYDGSYIFPEGDRFGFFPSVSAGWRLAQEDWFNNWTGDVFDRLKLRASYGQTGNDQIEPYQFLRTFGFNGQFAYADGLGTRIAQTRVPNEDITWEVATQFDLGLQGAVLGERLTFDLTYFRQLRDDILWFRSAAVPQTAGFSLPRENIAQVQTRGAEGQAAYTQNITSNITFRVAANLTYAKNTVEYFAEPEGVLPYQRNTGSPWGTGLYYLHDGIWNTQEEIDNNPSWPGARPGDVRFQDYNEDGVIDGADRVRIDEDDRWAHSRCVDT